MRSKLRGMLWETPVFIQQFCDKMAAADGDITIGCYYTCSTPRISLLLCFCCRGTIKRRKIWISDILARFLEALFKSKVQFLESGASQHSSTTSGVIVFFYQTSNGRRSIARTTSSLSKVITQSVARELRPWVSGAAGSLPAHLWSKQMPIHLLNLNRFTSE